MAAAVERAWQREGVWSRAADRLKTGPRRLRAAKLWLTIGAAAVALAASQVKAASAPASVALGVAAAVALAGAGVARSLASAGQVRRWTRARSVSEALKSEVYLFLCGGGDYRSGDSEARLRAAVRRLERDAGRLGLDRYTDGIAPRQRDLPAVRDIDSYLDIRVRGDLLERYYEPRARATRRRLRWLKIAEVTLALVAAGLAATAAVTPDVAAWAAVATTAGGAVAAHIGGERYEFLWDEYDRTARELRRLLDWRTDAEDRPLSGPDLAAACEQVISLENQAWMAKWSETGTGQEDAAGGYDGTQP